MLLLAILVEVLMPGLLASCRGCVVGRGGVGCRPAEHTGCVFVTKTWKTSVAQLC